MHSLFLNNFPNLLLNYFVLKSFHNKKVFLGFILFQEVDLFLILY